MGLLGERLGRHVESEAVPIFLAGRQVTGDAVDANVDGAALTVNEAEDDLDLAIDRFRAGLQAENAI